MKKIFIILLLFPLVIQAQQRTPATQRSISFTAVTPPSHKEGLLFYNTNNKAPSFYNNEADVTMDIGRELWTPVFNATGSTIANGKLVYFTGTTEGTTNLPQVALAQANAVSTSAVIGYATHSIENNTSGYVTTYGDVNGLNTNGITAGVPLYLSPSSAGDFTTTIPTAPNSIVQVGSVNRVDASAGVVSARVGGVGIRTRRSLNSITNNATHTGSTVETVLFSLLIPANSLGLNDALQFQSFLYSVGTTNTKTFRLYIGPTANTTVGATLIGTYQMPATTLSAGFSRRICNKQSQSTNNVFPATQSANSEDAASTSARTATNINFANTLYITITVQLANSGDTGACDNAQIYINQS